MLNEAVITHMYQNTTWQNPANAELTCQSIGGDINDIYNSLIFLSQKGLRMEHGFGVGIEDRLFYSI